MATYTQTVTSKNSKFTAALTRKRSDGGIQLQSVVWPNGHIGSASTTQMGMFFAKVDANGHLTSEEQIGGVGLSGTNVIPTNREATPLGFPPNPWKPTQALTSYTKYFLLFKEYNGISNTWGDGVNNISGSSVDSFEFIALPAPSVSAVTQTSITVTTAASAGNNTYSVAVYPDNTSGAAVKTANMTVSGSTASATITGLTANTTYYVAVAGSPDLSGSGYVYGPTTAVTTLKNAPGQAAISLLGFATTTSLDVTWGAVSGAETYEYYRSTSSTAPTSSTTPTATGLTGTSATISSLSSSTTYYVWLRAVNNGGAGAWSAAKSATTQSAVTAPGTPGTPAVAKGAKPTREAVVSWTGAAANGGTVTYSILRSTTTTKPGTAYATSVTTPWTDTAADQGADYYYWIRATNSAGSTDSAISAKHTPQTLIVGGNRPKRIWVGGVEITGLWHGGNRIF
ncbi:MAG: fibronectin type III domain-containing protein [Cellulomonadaceae bacterium]|jgi:hypothetical protein|nr:fibronectin type III domain-containing protein [Cellulomonadaceae bacterium]